MEPARIILNADDFGLSAEIDAGILTLLNAGRLSGVSIMAAGPLAAQDVPLLRPFADRADLGLHFCLTEIPTFTDGRLHRADGTPHTFGEVQARAWRGDYDRDLLRTELQRQWCAVRDLLGFAPAHIDSHQHVHQLPVIRDIVVEFVAALPEAERPYVRTAVDSPGTILRRGVNPARSLAFAWVGRGLRRRLQERRLTTNDGFSGVYDFGTSVPYRDRFRRFLRGARTNTIVLCHPGTIGTSGYSDPLSATRRLELAYLSGTYLPDDLAAAGVRLGRFRA